MMMPARHTQKGMEKCITSKIRVWGESRENLLSGSETVCESRKRRLAWGFSCGESAGLEAAFPVVGKVSHLFLGFEPHSNWGRRLNLLSSHPKWAGKGRGKVKLANIQHPILNTEVRLDYICHVGIFLQVLSHLLLTQKIYQSL